MSAQRYIPMHFLKEILSIPYNDYARRVMLGWEAPRRTNIKAGRRSTAGALLPAVAGRRKTAFAMAPLSNTS